MDKMSIWSVIFVSFPEEILFVITAMLIAGYTEIFDFKNIRNIIKILISSTLLVTCFDIGRYFLTSTSLYLVIEVIAITVTLKLIFRYDLKKTLIGTFNSCIILALSDLIIMVLDYKYIGISGEQYCNDDFLRIFLSIPKNIIQIIFIIILLKIKKIEFIAIRNKLKIILYLGLLLGVFILSVLLVFSMFNNFTIAKYEGFNLIVLIILGCYTIAVLLVLFYLSEEKKKRLMADKKRDGELERMKQLINEGKIEQVLDLIDYNRNNKEHLDQ